MIPIRDENPTRVTPYVVYVLIAANVLVFIIDWLGRTQLAPGFSVGGLWQYAMIPAQIVQNDPDIPARMGRFMVQFPTPEPVYITMFTSMFLHGGLLHLGGNMLYLWVFGNNIEDTLGHVKFVIFYIGGGLVAAIAHIASAPVSQVPTLGASGAVAAVLGAYLVLYPNSRITVLVFLLFFVTTVALPAVVVLGWWIFIQMISAVGGGGMTPGGGGVAYWAHIGGFAAGAVMILIAGGRSLTRGRRQAQRYRNYWYEE